MTQTKVKSILETSAFDPEARIDPHSRLKEIRDACPVFQEENGKTSFLMRYADVKEAVNDLSMWRHPRHAEKGALVRGMTNEQERPDDETTGILFLDEPNHSRVRLPIAKAFYTRINKMKTEIEAIIDNVIDQAPDDGAFDLISEIAIPIPILVIARILGVDEEKYLDFRAWSEAAILSLNPMRTPEQTKQMEWGSANLEAYFTELMAARRTEPKDDLISDMVALQAEGTPISDIEIRVNLGGLLIGGNLTTTDLIGNGVWLLLNHPEQLQALKADPGLASAAVEEILRYESPVAITTRVIPDEREISGCPMKPHHSVVASLHSANRDPDVFEAPDIFDVTVQRPSHVAFGGGTHTCIGAPLARIEARRVFSKIFQRYPDMQLAGQDIQWRALPFFRGMEELLVKV